MSEPLQSCADTHLTAFIKHLENERGASKYTVRNYSQTLNEFVSWHEAERKQPPVWQKLQRDDFRYFLRALGRKKLSRAATQLRFSALRVRCCRVTCSTMRPKRQLGPRRRFIPS